MSKHDKNCPPNQSITDYKLDLILEKVEGIESCMYGDDSCDGLKLDVDRLKRRGAAHNAVLWAIFTTLLGAAGTIIALRVGL